MVLIFYARSMSYLYDDSNVFMNQNNEEEDLDEDNEDEEPLYDEDEEDDFGADSDTEDE